MEWTKVFKLSLKDEEIIMKIKVTKPISTKDVVANFIGNLLTAAGGDIANNINMILTKEAIYLEAKGHVTLGYVEETRSIDKIDLKDIREFLVTPKENEEIITITTKKEEISLVRDNTMKDNLALALANVFKEIK